jgi:hypothetical protein
MDLVAEFRRLARSHPKVLAPAALLPFAVGLPSVAAETAPLSSSEMLSGAAEQRRDCWLALDFGTLHLANVLSVVACHRSRSPGHMLRVSDVCVVRALF